TDVFGHNELLETKSLFIKKVTISKEINTIVTASNLATKEMSGKLVVLEGDHTQNPPSYFEGLMSVGQDVDKIEVSSANKNLLNEVEAEGYYRGYVNGVLTVNKD